MSTLAILTQPEKEALAAAEADIRDGMGGFKKVGAALQTVCELRLYRDEFKTFDEYCASRWGFTRRRAYQQIENAKVAREIQERSGVVIEIESHAAALAAVPEEKREQIFAQIGAEGKVTAAKIMEAAGTSTETQKPRKSTSESAYEHAKDITESKFDTEIERLSAEMAGLIDTFGTPARLLVIDENLKYLRGLIEDRLTLNTESV